MRPSSGFVRGVALACSCLALGCDPTSVPTVANILVDFPGTTAANPPLLLYSGREGAACLKYQPSVANPTVLLHDVTNDPSCQVEIDAFAPGFGAFARDVDPLVPGDDGWLVDAIISGSLSVELPDLTTIPLRIWLVADAADLGTVEAVRDRLLDKAFPIFEELGAGLTLDTLSTTKSPSQVPKHCNDAGAISTNPAIYDAARINVYFVKHYGNTIGLTPANNCWLKSHPEIAFISWGNVNLTDPTLAHELGHALGLVHPNALGGHTYGVPGFDPYNVMATNVDVTDATIGQLYALNFSTDSWINRPGSPLLKPVVRACQDTWGPGPCPALTLTQPGWP